MCIMAYLNTQPTMSCSLSKLKNAFTKRLRDFLLTITSNFFTLNEASSACFFAKVISKQLLSFILYILPLLSFTINVNDDGDEAAITLNLVHQSSASMGVDLLISIKVRNWARRVLGLEMGVLEIINAASFM